MALQIVEPDKPKQVICDHPPRSLAREGDSLNRSMIPGGMDILGLLGTQFEDAEITTDNGAAMLSGRGGYARYQTTADPLGISQRRVTMRVSPCAPVQIARDVDQTSGLGCLVVANMDGNICHKISASTCYDNQLIHALAASDETGVKKPAFPALPSGVVCLTTLRSMQKTWEHWDAGLHLNNLMRDRGRSRHSVLPHVGQLRARSVVPQALPSFLSFLGNRKFSYARMVPTQGFIQADIAQKEQIRQSDQILISEGETSQLAVDLSQVAALWVTRIRRQLQLELYAKSGHCIAILAADPMRNLSDWNTLLEALPSVNRIGALV